MKVEEISELIANSEVWKKLGLNTIEWLYRALACATLMTIVAPTVNACTEILTNDTQKTIEITDEVQQNKDLIAVIENNNTEISTDSEPVNNKTNKWNDENTPTEWDENEGEEDFSCLREKPQWNSRLKFLESQYTTNDYEGIMRFNDDGNDDDIPSLDDVEEILKATTRNVICLEQKSNLLIKKNIKALKENSNIKMIKTSNGIISKEEFLKEVELFRDTYAKI